jgi:hypothetical protein
LLGAAPAKIPLLGGISMSTNRLETVTDVRLSVVVDAAANLTAELSELSELRERVRKAQLSPEDRGAQAIEKEHALRKQRPPQLAASFISAFATVGTELAIAARTLLQHARSSDVPNVGLQV